MIQDFLKLQLINIKDDAQIEKLNKTCNDVADVLSQDKKKILTYSLIAFDPEIPADNPEILEIDAIITKNWQTFHTNSNKNTKLTIARLVMLEALKILAIKDMKTASLIWFASRNTIKNYNLGREATILAGWLSGLGNEIEEKAIVDWSLSTNLESKNSKSTSTLLDQADLATNFQADPTKAALTINNAFKKIQAEIKDDQSSLNRFNLSLSIRTQLIWWKESGYSISLKDSYRKLKAGTLQVVIAFDYCSFIPEMHPISVDYFLVETIQSVSKKSEEKIQFIAFLKLIEDDSDTLKKILPEYADSKSRISFANFISGLVHNRFQISDFKRLVGIKESNQLSLSEITLWLFHDFHSVRLSNTK